MPTYDYQCGACGKVTSVFQTIGEYMRSPNRPADEHGTMQRRLSVVPTMSGLCNALAGDRHYDGLQASDGTDISTRSKHRAYMKRYGLTTADDYTQTWAKAEKERQAIRDGTFQDKELRQTIEREVYTAVAKSE